MTINVFEVDGEELYCSELTESVHHHIFKFRKKLCEDSWITFLAGDRTGRL